MKMKHKLIVLVAVLLSATAFAQNSTGVAVNADGSDAHVSAMLDVQSTTLGFLTPRMTLANRDAIVSPADGLLIYQTNGDKGFYFYEATGQTWVPIGGNLSQWSLTGNSGTDPANNFIGTIDEKALVFKTNAEERMRITSDGLLGIGTSFPAVSLDIIGKAKITGFRANAEIITTGFEGAENNAILGKNHIYEGRLAHYEDMAPVGAGVVGKSSTTVIGYLGYSGEGSSAKAVYGISNSSNDFSGYFEGGNVYIQQKLGLGTDNPVAKLEIAEGSLKLSNSDPAGAGLIGIQSDMTGTGNTIGIQSIAESQSAGNPAYGGHFSAIMSGDQTGTSYGMYATAAGSLVKNFAGYFDDGNVYIKNKLGLGTEVPSQQLELTGSIEMKNTTSSNTGILFKDGDRFLHDYGGEVSSYNTFLGRNAGSFSVSGGGSGEGVHNTGIGALSLNSLEWGWGNTAVGVRALQYTAGGRENTALGVSAGSSVSTGIGNTLLGYYAGSNLTTGSNNIAIGKSATIPSTTGNDQLVIGNPDFFYGNMGTMRIGIGTANPQAALDVKHTLSDLGQQIAIKASFAQNSQTSIGVYSDIRNTPSPIDNIAIYGAASGASNFNWAGYFDDGDVYIKNRLGIGTTNPTYELHSPYSFNIGGGNIPNDDQGYPSVKSNITSLNLSGGGSVGSGGHIYLTGGDGSLGGSIFLNGGTGNMLENGNIILANNVGNVGIGTNTPSAKLDVENSATTDYVAKFKNNYGAAGKGIYVSGYDMGIYSYAAGVAVSSISTQGYAVTAESHGEFGRGVYSKTTMPQAYSIYAEGSRNYFEGNVGIGTTSPNEKLHINGNMITNGNATITGNISGSGSLEVSGLSWNTLSGELSLQPEGPKASDGASIFLHDLAGSNPIQIINRENGKLSILQTGVSPKVGIGDNNPLANLDVVNNTNDAGAHYAIRARFGSASEICYGVYSDLNGNFSEVNYALYGSASGGTSGNWAGYFSAGDVYIQNDLGIGTTSPQAKLHVNGSIRGQHQSSDGSAGISGTRTWTVQLNLEETATHNVVIKDGIIVSWTIDYLP